MSFNIAETFELLFDKNNNTTYKALQELQKESEKTDCVYPYMDRLSNMLDSDNWKKIIKLMKLLINI